MNYDQLDPGIRETVRLLQNAGFDTTDSGDGVTKSHVDGCTMPFAHVAAVVTVEALISDAERMQAVLGSGWHVEASYSTEDRQALLLAVSNAGKAAVRAGGVPDRKK